MKKPDRFRLGAHESIADGFDASCRKAVEDGCEVIQIFTRSSRSWSTSPLDAGAIDAWKKAVQETGIHPFLVHDSYLINLGSPKKRIFGMSLRLLGDELARTEALGIPGLVLHPGAHLGTGEEKAIDQISEALAKLIDETPGFRTRFLLENTAGQGSTVGYRFEQLADILRKVNRPERMGVCIDTCHLFTSGYDISTDEGYDRTFKAFEEVVGLSWLKAFHLNDSRKPLNSRVDRHEHIGLGYLGENTFRRLLNDERFAGLGGVLETPVRENKRSFKDDLSVLRRLIAPPS